MNAKKGIKKLSLKKEAIVNLNDHEMGQVEGGWIQFSVSVVVATVGFTVDTYSKLWTCEPPAQPSGKVVNVTPHQMCEIAEVPVHGINTELGQ